MKMKEKRRDNEDAVPSLRMGDWATRSNGDRGVMR